MLRCFIGGVSSLYLQGRTTSGSKLFFIKKVNHKVDARSPNILQGEQMLLLQNCDEDPSPNGSG
jgi:hypothetical protein